MILAAFLAAILVSIAQTGCTGLTSANNQAPNDPPPPANTTISLNPGEVVFGNVAVGSAPTKNLVVTNTGTAALAISQVSVVGTGFSMNSMAMPVNVPVGQSATIVVKFAPTAAGSSTGGVAITANTNPAVSTIAATGTGTQTQSTISVSPGSVSFGNISVGGSANQTMTVTNTGGAAVSISSITTAGAGYSVSGFTLPVSIPAGQSTTFTCKFAPTVAGSSIGGIAITSNATPSLNTISTTGTGVQGQLSANPSSVSFGNVNVGSSSSQTVTLTNGGSASVVVSAATASGTGFSISGLTLPLTLAAGQSSSFTAKYAPAATGASSGSISVTSNAPGSPTAIALSGAGVQGQLTVSPGTVAFGSVPVGTTSNQTVTLTNGGSASVVVSAATATGTGFSITGLTLPLTLPAGQSSTFSARFAPTTGGAASGSISVVSNAPNSPATVTLSGTGVQGQLTASPSPVAFGTVAVGATGTQIVTLTNGGSASVTVSALTPAGAGFGVSGLTLPATIPAGQSSTFTATFAPAVAGAVTGSVTITSTAPNSPSTVSLSGTGTQPGVSATPSSASFGNVTVGSPNSQTIRISNTGSASLKITQANVSGAGFSINGLALPATIAAGSNTTFNVVFGPTSAGAVTGSVSLVSNAPNSPLSIPLTGTGVAQTFILNASSSNLAFGNVNVGSNATQNVTLTNAGNSTVTVSNFTITGTGFTATGVTNGLAIASGQTATLAVKFTPASTATISGTATVTSNATNSPLAITLSGTGVQVIAHSVTLTWTASTSAVTGYNVYRASITGGPYTLINSSLVAGTTYTDSTVLAGLTYFYVVTAVDSNGVESVHSNEASVVVPTP